MTQERQPKYLQHRFVSDLPPAKGSILVFDGTSLKWVRLVVGSNDQVLTADSTQAAGVKWAAGGGMSLIVKEADETVNNSAVLQNDDELLFAVAANEVWQFEGVLNIITSVGADFRLTFTGPTGAVGSFSAIYGDVQGGDVDAGSAALAGTLSLITASFAGRMVRFWGGIHNGANAGNLTLQWAQDTAEVSNTQVLAGSYIKYQIET